MTQYNRNGSHSSLSMNRRRFMELTGKGLMAGAAMSTLGFYPSTSNAAGELSTEQILKFGTLSGDILGPMDPMYNFWEVPWLHFIFDGLIRMKPGDEGLDKLEPDLATEYSLSDDRTIYTFKLRSGVRFQKGYGECTARKPATTSTQEGSG